MAHTTDAATAGSWASPGLMAEGCISWGMRKRGPQVIVAINEASTFWSNHACRLLLVALLGLALRPVPMQGCYRPAVLLPVLHSCNTIVACADPPRPPPDVLVAPALHDVCVAACNVSIYNRHGRPCCSCFLLAAWFAAHAGLPACLDSACQQLLEAQQPCRKHCRPCCSSCIIAA